ncbi:arabinose operon transcriptional regulator AraC [Devosia sp. Naph2]|uniref:arabinose operon transcriptional regulator AraC n=1 Tax=Devosia polycyclovorans TaxID=3345148 RepID=UPI0035CEC86A
MAWTAEGMYYPAMISTVETPHDDVLRLLTGHFDEAAGYRAYRPNGVGDWLLVLTLSGGGRFGHGAGNFRAEPGDWVLLPPGTPHDYGVADDAARWELVWAHFQPRADWHDWLRWPRLDGGLRVLRPEGDQDALVGQFLHVHDLLGSGQRRADALAMNALEALLLQCDMHNPPETGDLDRRVRRAMAFMEAHLAERVSVEDVSREAGLSPSRLSHLFRAETGQSVQGYLEGARLRRAGDLLRRTSFPVKQIAAEVGFDSPFYFSRRFSRATGYSPQAFRRWSGQSRGAAEQDS